MDNHFETSAPRPMLDIVDQPPVDAVEAPAAAEAVADVDPPSKAYSQWTTLMGGLGGLAAAEAFAPHDTKAAIAIGIESAIFVKLGAIRAINWLARLMDEDLRKHPND